MRVELVAYMPHVHGNFGAPEEQAWTITIGMNARGGMDDVEFDEYLSNSLIPLYSGAEDVNGKRVFFKLESGLDQLGMKLLARLRLLGFVFYFGVQNTTRESQKTYRNYSPFKTEFRIILDKHFQERMLKKKKRALNPWLLGLVVFGGVVPETGVLVQKNAFQEGFSNVQCLKAWAKIVGAPMMRACLSDKQARRKIGDAYDEMNFVIQELNDTNAAGTFTLSTRSYRVDMLSAR